MNTPILRIGIRAVCLIAGVGALTTGCQHVSPMQRATLSDMTMRGDRDPLGTSMSEHVFFSREAASGGRGVGGGGCGCN